MNYKDAEYRYRNDAAFRQLVDMLDYQMEQLHFSASELREAAVLAAIKFESRNIRPMPLGPDILDRTANE